MSHLRLALVMMVAVASALGVGAAKDAEVDLLVWPGLAQLQPRAAYEQAVALLLKEAPELRRENLQARSISANHMPHSGEDDALWVTIVDTTHVTKPGTDDGIRIHMVGFPIDAPPVVVLDGQRIPHPLK